MTMSKMRALHVQNEKQVNSALIIWTSDYSRDISSLKAPSIDANNKKSFFI